MHVFTAQFDMQRTIDYMETVSWRFCASYLSRIGAILDGEMEGLRVGALTGGEEDDLANELMISAAMAKGGTKMRNTAGGFGDGAISPHCPRKRSSLTAFKVGSQIWDHSPHHFVVFSHNFVSFGRKIKVNIDLETGAHTPIA
jgi:hypothetical protein